jgi:hypothetical protein
MTTTPPSDVRNITSVEVSGDCQAVPVATTPAQNKKQKQQQRPEAMVMCWHVADIHYNDAAGQPQSTGKRVFDGKTIAHILFRKYFAVPGSRKYITQEDCARKFPQYLHFYAQYRYNHDLENKATRKYVKAKRDCEEEEATGDVDGTGPKRKKRRKEPTVAVAAPEGLEAAALQELFPGGGGGGGGGGEEQKKKKKKKQPAEQKTPGSAFGRTQFRNNATKRSREHEVSTEVGKATMLFPVNIVIKAVTGKGVDLGVQQRDIHTKHNHVQFPQASIPFRSLRGNVSIAATGQLNLAGSVSHRDTLLVLHMYALTLSHREQRPFRLHNIYVINATLSGNIGAPLALNEVDKKITERGGAATMDYSNYPGLLFTWAYSGIDSRPVIPPGEEGDEPQQQNLLSASDEGVAPVVAPSEMCLTFSAPVSENGEVRGKGRKPKPKKKRKRGESSKNRDEEEEDEEAKPSSASAAKTGGMANWSLFRGGAVSVVGLPDAAAIGDARTASWQLLKNEVDAPEPNSVVDPYVDDEFVRLEDTAQLSRECAAAFFAEGGLDA